MFDILYSYQLFIQTFYRIFFSDIKSAKREMFCFRFSLVIASVACGRVMRQRTWGEWGDPAPVLMRNDQMRPEPERVQPPLISQQITTFVQNKLLSSTSPFIGGNEPFWEHIFLCFDFRKHRCKTKLVHDKNILVEYSPHCPWYRICFLSDLAINQFGQSQLSAGLSHS